MLTLLIFYILMKLKKKLKKMFYFRNNNCYEEILNEIKERHLLIDVKPGKYHYNFYCHNNSVHYAIENKDERIALCFQVSKVYNLSYPIIHFLNYTDGVFVDNTLGNWTINNDYYFVKFVNKEDFFEIDQVFSKFRKKVKDYYVYNWWNKKFSNIKF